MIGKKVHTGQVVAVPGNAITDFILKKANGMDKASSVGFQVTLAPGAAGATVFTAKIYKSADKGVNWAEVPSWTWSGAGGNYDGSEYSQDYSLAAAGSFWIDVDVRNSNALKLELTTDTADVGDAVTVIACSNHDAR